MKKTLTTLALLGLIAAPAFANDAHTSKSESTSKSTYTERVTYRQVEVPLTPEQVTERQVIGTKIGADIRILDTNNDGELNRAEFSYGAHRFTFNDTGDFQSTFRSIDRNGDAQLSSQELLEAELATQTTPETTVVETEEHTYKAARR